MNKIKILILSLLIMLVPALSLGATGHINGCTNTSFDTNCCTKTFRITPQAGYTVTDVIVNGVSQGPLTSYTFSNITGPQTLKVITTANAGGGTGGTGSGTGTGGTVSGGPYTIRFNANGGTGTMANQTYEAGVGQTLPTNTFTKNGFSFMGWSTTSAGDAIYTDGDYYTATQNQTLYAVWKESAWVFVIRTSDYASAQNITEGLNFLKPGSTIQASITQAPLNYSYFYLDDVCVASANRATLSYTYPVYDKLWIKFTNSGDWDLCSDCDENGKHRSGCTRCDYNLEYVEVYAYTYNPESGGSATQLIEIVNSSDDPLYVYDKSI